MLYHESPGSDTTSTRPTANYSSSLRNAKRAATQQQVTALVGRTLHHANRSAAVPGTPLPGRLSSSRRTRRL